MEHYFVVLHFPGGKKLRLGEKNKRPQNIINKALLALGTGKARLVSRRQDTGATDDIRNHARDGRFKNYLLVNMPLDQTDCPQNIFTKVATHLTGKRTNPTLIDASENYQLLTVE